MGQTPSRARSSMYRHVRPFVQQGAEELFEIDSIESASSLEYRVSDSIFDSVSSNINALIIANILLNPGVLTEYSSDYEEILKVIIPSLSQSICSDDVAIMQAHALFRFCCSRSQFFNKTHDIIPNYQPVQNFLTDHFVEDTVENERMKLAINSILVSDLEDPSSIVHLVENLVPTPIRFGTHSPPLFNRIHKKILSFLASQETDLKFLYSSFLWGFTTGHQKILFETLTTCMRLVDSPTNVEPVKFDSKLFQKIRTEHFFNASLDHQNGLITNDIFKLRHSDQKAIFCATNDSIIILNAGPTLVKISINKSIPEKMDRFSTIKFKASYIGDPFFTISDNYIYVGEVIDPVIMTINPFEIVSTTITYDPPNSPQIRPPLTSDGHFIFSLTGSTEISVFSISNKVIHYHTTIKLKLGNVELNAPYGKNLIPKKMTTHASVATNGVVIQFLLLEGDRRHFNHFVRTFSLIDGSHISDNRFSTGYPIHAWTYEPFDKNIWCLSPHAEGSVIFRFESKISCPPWISGFSYTPDFQISKLKNVLNQGQINAEKIIQIILMLFGIISFPLIGSANDNEKETSILYNYVAPASPLFIESVINTINALIELRKTSEKLKPHYYVSVMLMVIHLNLSNSRLPITPQLLESLCQCFKNVINEDPIFTKQIFYIFVTNFDIMFTSTPSLIPDLFSMFFERFTFISYKLLISNVSTSPLFIYLFSQDNFYGFYTQKLIDLKNMNSTIIELNFFTLFQSALFAHLENYVKNPTEKMAWIMGSAESISHVMIERIISFLGDIEQYDDNQFKNNYFIQLFNKFLIVVSPVLSFQKFAAQFLQQLHPLIPTFVNASVELEIQNPFTAENEFTEFYKLFTSVYFVFTSCLLAMFNNGKKTSIQSKFISIIRSYRFYDPSNKVDQNDSEKLRAYFYKCINNPMNKLLKEEDKQLESHVLFALASYTKTLKKMRRIFDNQIQEIPTKIKNIIKAVYKIRGNIRVVKQSDAEKQQDFHPYIVSLHEKCDFLCSFTDNESSEDILKQLTEFLTNRMTVHGFIELVDEVKTAQKNLGTAFTILDSLQLIHDFPPSFHFSFFTTVTHETTIVEETSLLSRFSNSSSELINSCLDLIRHISDLMGAISGNAVMSFSSILILILINLKGGSAINEALSIMFSSLIKDGDQLDVQQFETYFSFLCYLYKILLDNNIIDKDQEFFNNLSKSVESLPSKYSGSFLVPHSIMHVGFSSSINTNDALKFLTKIPENQFHSYSFYLYEIILHAHDINEPVNRLIDIIGSTFCGVSTPLFNDIPFINDLWLPTDSKYCTTPSAKMNACIEIITVLRRILNSNIPASKKLEKLLLDIISQTDFSNYEVIKKMISVFIIITGTFETIRPYSRTHCTKNNKSYFVISIDEKEMTFTGLPLPISTQIGFQTIPLDDSFIPHYHNHILSPFSSVITPRFLDLKINSANSLLSFFSLSYLKECISDIDTGSDFTSSFLKQLSPLPVTSFVFNDRRNDIKKLIESILSTPSDGIFTKPSKTEMKLYHVPLTRVVIPIDFDLNDDSIKTTENKQLFISNILRTDCDTQLVIKGTKYHVGVITHSATESNLFSVYYSTSSGQLTLNHEVCARFACAVSLEVVYSPAKCQIIFGDQFPIKFKHKNCSFFIYAHENTEISYSIKQTALTSLSSPSTPEKPQSNGRYYAFNKCVDEITQSDQILQSGFNGTPELATFMRFTKIQLPETNAGIQFEEPIFYQSEVRPDTILGSLKEQENYLEVSNVDYSIHNVDADDALMFPHSYLPPIYYDRYDLPPEILNIYLTELCKQHKQEIVSFLVVRTLATRTTNLQNTLNFFSMTPALVLEFVVSMLLLLEPIGVSNLREGRSPIDSNFNVLSDGYICQKAAFFDHNAALRSLISYIRSDSTRCKDFIKLWFDNLESDFNQPLNHFITASSDCIIAKSVALSQPQTYVNKNATGWFVVPLSFGLRQVSLEVLTNKIFPKQDGYATYAFCEGNQVSIQLATQQIQFGLFPFFAESNSNLFDTFFKLAVSFKYFVLFLAQNLTELNYEDALSLKIKLRKILFTAIMSGSPIFYSHDDVFLRFLNQNLSLSVNDFTPAYVETLNLLALGAHTFHHLAVDDFIMEQSSLFEDHKAVIYRAFFPEFCDPSDPLPPPEGDFVLPPQIIQNDLKKSSNPRQLLLNIKRILTPTNSIINFPFHLVLYSWVESFVEFPPVEIRKQGTFIITIKFLDYVPEQIKIIDRDSETINNSIEVSDKIHFVNAERTTLSSTINVKASQIHVRFNIAEDISQHSFVVVNAGLMDKTESALKYKAKFVSDMTEMVIHWTKREDQQILRHVPPENFRKSVLPSSIDRLELTTMEPNRQTHLVALRAKILIAFNWICTQYQELTEGERFAVYRPYISMLLSKDNFRELLEETCTDKYENLRINRKMGLEVRNGVSNRLDQSMIAQFSSQYRSPANFRNNQRPFHVEYIGENGIDVGGLARDFASELVRDLNEPKVGLFVQTPNGRNQVGMFRECLVPSPDPNLQRSQSYYRALGGLIAISIRCALVQPFQFPPFFWHYLAGGSLTPNHIFEIDEHYKLVITSLNEALASNMTADQFNEKFDMKSMVLNLRGLEVPVGNMKKVTLDTCSRYIAQCHEIRIMELEQPLKAVRNGFWENLNFQPPSFVTPELLEFLACGDRGIDLRQLRAITEFTGFTKDEIAMFWATLARMTNEQRRGLLQFITGTMCVPQNATMGFLTVDAVFGREDSKLPIASTCFYRLHLPKYSSVEKMFHALITAIEYTGTFENS